jgi:hypothetical protein
MEISQIIHLKAELATTGAPFLNLAVRDAPHYSSSVWLHYHKTILLDSYPGSQFIVVLDKYFSSEKMSVEAFVLRQNGEDIPSGFNFIHMPELVVLLQNVSFVVLAFSGGQGA